MKIRILSVMIMLLIFVNLGNLSAVPKVSDRITLAPQVDIIPSLQQNIKQFDYHNLNFMTHNTTDGIHIDNETLICRFVMEDHRGRIMTAQWPPYNETGDFWTAFILAGNFSRVGQYNWVIDCHDEQETVGGVSTGSFLVNPSGFEFENSSGFYWVMLLILVGIIILGFSIKEHWFVILGGMGLIMLGIYTINNGLLGQKDMFMTWGVALFEITVGAILSIGAGIQKMDYD